MPSADSGSRSRFGNRIRFFSFSGSGHSVEPSGVNAGPRLVGISLAHSSTLALSGFSVKVVRHTNRVYFGGKSLGSKANPGHGSAKFTSLGGRELYGIIRGAKSRFLPSVGMTTIPALAAKNTAGPGFSSVARHRTQLRQSPNCNHAEPSYGTTHPQIQIGKECSRAGRDSSSDKVRCLRVAHHKRTANGGRTEERRRGAHRVLRQN
jgi:hypothetical protein